MPTQADFHRVTSGIIEPMKRHWGVEFDSDTIADFVDDLARYDAETLKNSMIQLRREQKRKPSLAHVVEACDALAPTKPSGSSNQKRPAFHCIEHAEIAHPISAKKILCSPEGQLALSLGAGRDLLVEYECSGRTEFDDDFVRKCKKGLDSAASELNKLDADLPDAKRFHSMFDMMMDREKRLYAQFYGKNQPVITRRLPEMQF